MISNFINSEFDCVKVVEYLKKKKPKNYDIFLVFTALTIWHCFKRLDLSLK